MDIAARQTVKRYCRTEHVRKFYLREDRRVTFGFMLGKLRELVDEWFFVSPHGMAETWGGGDYDVKYVCRNNCASSSLFHLLLLFLVTMSR